MGEYVILCHFKAFQIPLHHSTNKKNNENSEKKVQSSHPVLLISF